MPHLLVALVTVPIHAARPVSRLASPPPGATLPVALSNSLSAQKLTAGRIITARLLQRVPLSDHSYLPDKTEIVGHVVGASASSLGILFTELRWKGQTVPIHVRLVAAASSNNVYQTKLPIGGTDRSTANPQDWTTRQVEGDEIYRSSGWGKVYNRYSEPVGYANLNGVYANPASVDAVLRAVGPFSTTATGLHGFRGFSIVSPGGAGIPIALDISRLKWRLAGGGALLLEIVR